MKIVATVGPASTSPQIIKKLILSGLNVARLNMAHGSHDEHSRRIDTVRAMALQTRSAVGILMDLPGPKLRVAKISGPSLELKRNDEVFLTANPLLQGKNIITISYKDLIRDVKKNEAIYISDGLIRVCVDGIQGEKIWCTVTHGGTVHVGAGVNFPHSMLSMEAFTSTDKKHLEFGLKKGIDFVGISFVGNAGDIARVRRFCNERSKNPFIIAKIERAEALDNLEKIIDAADGVMVARGDLGIEVPFYKLPVIQNHIVNVARQKGKPVIVATQVLESMIQNPRPTRAEATDVATAISQGADAIMLSGESAVGNYPVESVRALTELIKETERSDEFIFNPIAQKESEPKIVMAQEACRIAEKVNAKVILVQTQTGRSALRISRFRPRVPLLALVDEERVRRRLTLFWGVQALVKSIKVSIYHNTSLFRWLHKVYNFEQSDRAVLVDTPANSGKVVVSVIEGRSRKS